MKDLYNPMQRSIWTTNSSLVGDRLKVLVDAIENGQKIPDVDGNDVVIANTKENKDAIETFKNDTKLKSVSLKLVGGGSIETNKIGKSSLFGGQGKGKGATGDTEKGECLQCIFLTAMSKESRGTSKPFEYYTAEILENYYDSSKLSTDFATILSAPIQWHYSAYTSAKYLLNERIVDSTYTFHRGDRTMKAIYSAKTKALRLAGLPALQDDKWNPGDIWAVKSGFQVSTLDKKDIIILNNQIKDLHESGKLIGISLKIVPKLTDKATSKIFNKDGGTTEDFILTGVELKAQKAGTAKYWSAKKVGLNFKNTGTNKNYTAEIRASSNGAAPSFQIEGATARGGRAGWDVQKHAVNAILKPQGLTLKNSIQYISAEAKKIKDGNTQEIEKLWSMIDTIQKDSKLKPTVRGMVTKNEFMEGLNTAKGKDINFIHPKMLGTYVLYAFAKQKSQKIRDEAISYMGNHANATLDISSMFLKVATPAEINS